MGWFAPMLVLAAAPVLLDMNGSPSFIAAMVLSFATSGVNLLLAKIVGIL